MRHIRFATLTAFAALGLAARAGRGSHDHAGMGDQKFMLMGATIAAGATSIVACGVIDTH